MGNFTPISNFTKARKMCAMKTAWVHSGPVARHWVAKETSWHILRAGVNLEIGVNFPMRAASVEPKHTHNARQQNIKTDLSSPTSNRLHSTRFVKTSAPGGLLSSGTAVLSDFLKKTPNKNKTRKIILAGICEKLAVTMTLCSSDCYSFFQPYQETHLKEPKAIT